MPSDRALVAGSLGVLVVSCCIGVAVGPAHLPIASVVRDLLGVERLPKAEHDILVQIRLPRVALGAVVGAALAGGGAAYQGAFRNALADPYLLGVAAGAGLGATIVIAAGHGGAAALLPIAAFAGGVAAVALTYALGATSGRDPATLVLAGVAVAAFCTAAQTYVQQTATDQLRLVYTWILGRLSTAGWSEVTMVLPYVAVSSVVLIAARRQLDVLQVGDVESAALGVRADRVRLAVVAAATLGTAAAVSVSGLIGFVGIIVPHLVRLVVGPSYRLVVPLSILLGAAFLVLTDVVARTIVAPGELPIGVITAFVGAPFFLIVLRTRSLVNP